MGLLRAWNLVLFRGALVVKLVSTTYGILAWAGAFRLARDGGSGGCATCHRPHEHGARGEECVCFACPLTNRCRAGPNSDPETG